jgi:hypothetical protein
MMEDNTSQQIRLRIETLLILLRDIEAQRKVLAVQQGKGSAFEKMLDQMNRAEYCLKELETDNQKSL